MPDIDKRFSNGFNLIDDSEIMEITYKIEITSEDINIADKIEEIALAVTNEYNKLVEVNRKFDIYSDDKSRGFYIMINTRTLKILEDILKKYAEVYNYEFTMH